MFPPFLSSDWDDPLFRAELVKLCFEHIPFGRCAGDFVLEFGRNLAQQVMALAAGQFHFQAQLQTGTLAQAAQFGLDLAQTALAAGQLSLQRLHQLRLCLAGTSAPGLDKNIRLLRQGL
jgi:hypothetical protein